MLRLLRKKEHIKKIIFSILIFASVMAFVFWGVGASRMSSKNTHYAGEIFGRKVPIQEFMRARSTCLNNIRLRFGENYNKILPYLNLNSQAWMQLILLEEAKKAKISISDEEVVQAVTNNPIFFRGGKFNQENYNRLTHYYFNVQPREFEEETRRNLTIAKLYDRLTANVKVTEEELLEAYKREFQTLSVNYIKAGVKDPTKDITASDEQLKDYCLNNPDKFKRPPTLNIEYIGIDYPPDAKETDKIKSYKKLESLYRRLKAKDDLKKLALKPFVYQESGFFAADEPIKDIGYNAQFHKYAFSLKEKGYSPIIQASKGVYIIRVIQKRDSYLPDFQEIKDQVKEVFLNDRSDEEAKKKIQDCKTKISEVLNSSPDAQINKIVQGLGLEMKTTPAFSREESIPETGLGREFSEIAFGLKPNQTSELLKADSAYYLIWQDKFTEIDEEKFKQEKENYRSKILDAKRLSEFNALTEELVKKANPKDYSLQ